MQPRAPKAVLVLRMSSAGDVVLTSPALEALRRAWPETRIVYAVKLQFATMVRANPNVDEVIELDAKTGVRAMAARLRTAGCDALLDLQANPRSRALRWALRIPRTVVWEKRPWLDNVTVRLLRWKPYRASTTIANRYHRAVERLVGRELPPGELRHWVAEEDLAAAREALAKAGVDPARPLLGISPGATWETKRWPAERYGELARRALAAGAQVVLTGSPDEAPLAGTVKAIAPGCVDLAGALTLGSLGGVISLCTAFAANDSGPMHMARALGVPSLAFFGSTDPRQFEWDGHALQSVQGLPCAPCSFYGLARCPKGHFRCMLDLDVERAWGALQPLLARARGERLRVLA